jgi:hypothetical protein
MTAFCAPLPRIREGACPNAEPPCARMGLFIDIFTLAVARPVERPAPEDQHLWLAKSKSSCGTSSLPVHSAPKAVALGQAAAGANGSRGQACGFRIRE